MVSISTATTTTTSKSLQIVLSIILIGLTSKILSDRSSLSSAADLLSDYNSSTNGTSLSLSNSWKIEASSLSSSTFTLASTVFNYFYPTTATSLFKSLKTTCDSTISDYNFITLSVEDVANSSPLSISSFHTAYLTSLVSSETISNSFWFVNMIIQISDFASTDCYSIENLLDNYNLTGISTTESLLNYFNLFSNENDTVSNIYEEFYSALNNLNLTNIENLSLTSLNGSTLQSNLLLSLNQDCQIKKSSMALTILIWVSHLFSSGILTFEMVSFFNKFSQTKIEALKIIQLKKKDEEEKEKEKENENEEDENQIKNSNEHEFTEDDEKDKKSLGNKNNSEILLTFTHRWGLYDISFKDNSTDV